jgi:hypothetical protein
VLAHLLELLPLLDSSVVGQRIAVELCVPDTGQKTVEGDEALRIALGCRDLPPREEAKECEQNRNGQSIHDPSP